MLSFSFYLLKKEKLSVKEHAAVAQNQQFFLTFILNTSSVQMKNVIFSNFSNLQIQPKHLLLVLNEFASILAGNEK